MVEWVQNDWKCISISCLHRNRVADWDLQLSAAAQHHERVSYHILIARGEVKIQKFVVVYFPLARFSCVSSGSLRCIWT